MAEVKLSIEEYHNVVKSLYTLIEKLYETTKEGNDYKRQRDELINDMQNVKRKAEAFDEMVKIYKQKNDLPSDEIFMEMGYCISDLERGSDE
ncbi:hypothetical protein [Staphylococcus hominis]|uniref:hypothetical protein n=1 Tax=Staphylococcus hominis TaxID=1290 RepID=UPI003204922F